MSLFRPGRNNRFRALRLGAWCWSIALLWLFAFAQLVMAQAPTRSAAKFYPDSSDTAEALLRNAAGHVRDRQWSEAIEIYQRVIDQFGDKVGKLPRDEPGTDPSGDFVLFVDDRKFCHRALAHMPAEAREIYRKRADSVAERWFRQGQAEGDTSLLRRVVDRAFCSSWGDDALELLGDLAFQDGRFGEALAHYGRLVADRPDDVYALVHPDPSVDLARIAAKKMLARAALGENPPTRTEIEEFPRRYPNTSGALAGRTGKYGEILAQALASDGLAPPLQPESRWPTFAGSLRRTKIAAGPIDAGSIQWRVELDRVPVNRAPSGFGPRALAAQAPIPPERLLAFHPIVLGDQVIVTDGARVLAYNLNDRPSETEGGAGRLIEPAWKHDPESGAQAPQAMRMYGSIPRYTLTAVGHRIYMRGGAASPAYLPGMGGMSGRGSSSIVALDWNTQGKLLWEQKSSALVLPNRTSNRSVSFEGTPVADARSVYVAVTDRREQTATYIACFDAETGASRWVRYLGTASTDVENFMGFGGMPPQFGGSVPGDYNHRLLSLDGPTLYYQTNLGALVALEAETGSTLWVATYPRQDPEHLGSGSERDLNPAVVDGGMVYVAPSDANSIFAFDAQSGRLRWKSEPISSDVKLSHLLGVAQGRLIATGDRVLLFDAKTGELRRVWPDAGKAEGYGRGLLAGDLIYWPTRTEIQVLNQRTGMRTEPPIKLQETYRVKGGNLVAGDGYLIVAQSDGLVVFCQNSRLIERYRDQIAQAPERAANYFRLARAAEALGRDQLALDSYRLAAQKAHSNETIDEVLLSGAARDHQFRLLVRMAGQSRRMKQWTDAATHLESAARVARADAERLQAKLLLADVLMDSARPRDAIDLCEQILTDERLRPLSVATADGHRTIRADLYITDRLNSIVRDHGRDGYAPYDQKAARLFERGQKEKGPRILDELCRLYPVARVVPDALVELGSIYEATDRLAEAAHTYKRLMTQAGDDAHKALALARLARVHEARKLLLSARDSYLDLQARFPTVVISDHGRALPAAELVAAELAKPPYSQLAANRPMPPTPIPMVRRWHWQAPSGQAVRVIAAEGIAPSLEASRLLLVEKNSLRLLDPSTGAPRWLAEPGEPVIWAGYLADKLIAATPRQIFGLELAAGTVQWRHGQSRSRKDADRPDPFAKAEPAQPDDAGNGSGESMSGFQLVKGRVFFLRGTRELVALDGDTGVVDWRFSSPPGEIKPNLWIGADRSVLQVDKPNQLLVLRTDDGQLMARIALGEKELLERPPLPLDDDSVLFVPDRRTVKKLDLNHGQVSWICRETDELPLYGPPRLFGDAERLLVLHDGRLLIRLDPATGSKKWSCLLGIEDLSERPGSIAFDDKRLFCANRQTLRAIALETGQPIWARHLSGPQDAIWSIALSQHHVVAYPSTSGLTDGDEVENMPVIIRRRDDGALVQRFVFPTTIAEVICRIDPRGALVATSRGLWGLGQKEQSSSSTSALAR
jgi:outer membrane protein assembly factor BamB/tetratricopeptide (TPR) repeat protein